MRRKSEEGGKGKDSNREMGTGCLRDERDFGVMFRWGEGVREERSTCKLCHPYAGDDLYLI